MFAGFDLGEEFVATKEGLVVLAKGGGVGGGGGDKGEIEEGAATRGGAFDEAKIFGAEGSGIEVAGEALAAFRGGIKREEAFLGAFALDLTSGEEDFEAIGVGRVVDEAGDATNFLIKTDHLFDFAGAKAVGASEEVDGF